MSGAGERLREAAMAALAGIGGIGRVYDAALAQQVLGFRCRTGFEQVLEALRAERDLPFAHDPEYCSPKERPR